MEPKKKVELVEVEYWECRHPSHRHKSYATAMKCMERNPGGPQSPDWAPWRNGKNFDLQKKIVRSLINGDTQKQASERHGVTVEQVKSAYSNVSRAQVRKLSSELGRDIERADEHLLLPCYVRDARKNKHYWAKVVSEL